jgi:nucleotide-binding universal stress UspA family protein
MMRTIVVGIDTELPSRTALDWVIERTALLPARVRLVTVLGERPFGTKKAERHMLAAAERFRAARPELELETRLVGGTGISEVLAAEAADADLLVVGHHRGRIMRSMLTGALSTQIEMHAACPTVVVPSDWLRRFGKVVVGIDDDESSDAALDFAAEEAATTGRTLDIVHVTVAEDHPGSSIVIGKPDEPSARGALVSRAVERACAGRRGLAIRTYSASGDPNRILRAHGRQAALVVLGSHGDGAIDAVLRNSTAYSLGNWSMAPVCVVPAGWRAGALEESTA